MSEAQDLAAPGADASPEEWLAFAKRLKDAKQAKRDADRLGWYKPYAKQADFHAMGAEKRERLFMAGNQLGKTFAGAAETSMHLTGRYPDWWKGRRFDHAVNWLAGSESSELTRDGVQRLLVGPPKDESAWGTGYVPKDALMDWSRKQGVPDALDSITVKHKNGGHSTLLFKSYDQGRSKWQANTVHGVWFDEEPPADVYSEGMTRTNATRGMVYLTFTPLLGMSEVVRRFLMEPSPDRGVVTMTIHDAEHYTPEERAQIIASYPEHERDARTSGIPILGSGRVFPLADTAVLVDPVAVPRHWRRIGGIDFGWDHPTAAVELAYDADLDVVYVTREHRLSKATPAQHAATLRTWSPRGSKLPWAWPHDGHAADKGSGKNLAVQYRTAGLNMLGSHATFKDGTNGVEAGVLDMLTRMRDGRWKVFTTCGLWMEEFRLYHREDGKIVKEMDDLISASRYAYMMLRHARVAENAHSWRPGEKPQAKIAAGTGEVDW